MRWLLDTNGCIAVIRQRPQQVLPRLRGKQVVHVGLSSITLAEIEFGAAKSQHAARARAALREFLLPLELAPFDDASAQAYGTVRSGHSTR